jgi:hypothetical protein
VENEAQFVFTSSVGQQKSASFKLGFIGSEILNTISGFGGIKQSLIALF